jgi:NitT/TauT family transport system permease protein
MQMLSWFRRFAGEARDPAALLLIIVVVWEIASRFGFVPAYLLPSPSSILVKTWTLRAELAGHTAVTLMEILASFILAVAVGVVLALLVVYVRVFERAVYPLIVISQAIPKVALAPLFVVWLGFGFLPKVIIGVLIAFFPILVGVVIGMRSVDPEAVYLLQSMGAGRSKIFLYLRLPTTLPNLFGAMRVAVTLATVGAIVAEFIGANEGLGYVLVLSNGTQDTPLLFSALVLISLLAVILYFMTAVLERACIRWHVSGRHEAMHVTM